jgi:uncharacterized protein (TIGR03437 family)
VLYASFLGGGSGETGQRIQLDAAGNIYVMGVTNSVDFPLTSEAIKKTSAPQQEDIYIAKLNPAGSALVYSTYLGSDKGSDEAYGLAVDATGSVYLAGRTSSPDFPVTAGAAQSTFAGPFEAFVSKINATGSALLSSTMLGGGGDDWARDIAIDAAGGVYVTGETTSSDFPTTAGALQKNLGTNLGNAFIVKYTAAGAVAYATYYGSGNLAYGNAIEVDSVGNAYVAGDISASAGVNVATKFFALKLNPSGSQLLFNFIPDIAPGNTANAAGAALDSAGNYYMTGFATSGLPITAGAFQTAPGGQTDAFVLKLNAAGSITYLTYLGGRGTENGSNLALDDAGNIYVVGVTLSENFPVTNAAQGWYGGGDLPFGDGFVAKLNAAGSTLVYSTYLGDYGSDYVNDIAVNGAGEAFVVGGTMSPGFPVTMNAPQTVFKGPSDAFIAKIGEGSIPLTNVSAASYRRNGMAPESLAAAFGPKLATATQAASGDTLPTTLAGTSVMVKDGAGVERLAPLFFVSPNQINYQIPPGSAAGTALVKVNNPNGIQAQSLAYINDVAPALFTANSTGEGAGSALALRVRGDGSQSYEPIVRFDQAMNQYVPLPIDFGQDDLYLILFGTGIRHRKASNPVFMKIDNIYQPAAYAGPQGSFFGLDQVDVLMPRSLAGRGETRLAINVDGKQSNGIKVDFK